MNTILIVVLSLLSMAFSYCQQEENLVPYFSNGKWGFSHTNLAVIIPAEYDHVSFFHEKYAKAEINGKYGYIDMYNQPVIPIIYDECERINMKTFLVSHSGKAGLIGINDTILLPIIYDSVKEVPFQQRRSYDDNFKDFLISKNGKVGLINLVDDHIQQILDPEFVSIQFIDGVNQFRCRVSSEIIRTYDEDGKFLQEFNNNRKDKPVPKTVLRGFEIGSANDSRSTKCTEKIDSSTIANRNLELSAIYGGPNYLENHKQTITVKDVWKTKISDTLETTVEIEYDRIEDGPRFIQLDLFMHGWIIFNDRKCGLLGGEPKIKSLILASALLIPIEYSSIVKYGNGDYIIVEKEGNFGLMSQKNFQLTTPIKYKYIDPNWFFNFFNTGNRLFKVVDFNDKTFFIDQNGVEYVDL